MGTSKDQAPELRSPIKEKRRFGDSGFLAEFLVPLSAEASSVNSGCLCLGGGFCPSGAD